MQMVPIVVIDFVFSGLLAPYFTGSMFASFTILPR
jgi:hypothetical protein